MLLERSQWIVGVVATAVLLLGTYLAIIVTGGGLTPGITVHAVFEDAAGLEEKNFVFVAGVRVGKVSDVEIDGEQALVSFKLDTEVPNDSGADIFLQNTLGKRAIKVIPGSSETMFAEGDTIPIERTSTPVDIPQLGDETVKLLRDSDVDALQSLTVAVGEITEGARQDVIDLLDGIERITRVIADRKSELATVIQRATVLIDAAASKDGEIKRTLDGFSKVMERLAARRADISNLLKETAATSEVAADLLTDERARLDRVLSELHDDLDILDAHQVEIAHFLAYAGTSVDGFAGIGYANGPARDDVPLDTGGAGIYTLCLGSEQIAGDGAPDGNTPPCFESSPDPEWRPFIGQSSAQAGPASNPIFACGGPIDVMLTGIIGQDPNCIGAQSVTAASVGNARYASWASFFDDAAGSAGS